MASKQPDASRPAIRVAYVVSHPIQYQAPLLRRIAQEPDIDLTVFFGSDISLRGYQDEGFGVEVAWDVPLLEGYRSAFLPRVRDNGTISPTNPINRGLYKRFQNPDGSPAFDALWVHGYSSVNALHAITVANMLGIPVLLRAESWLEDRERSGVKLAGKHLFFRALRPAIAATLPIGTKNREYWAHYFGANMPQFAMPYAVDNAFFAERAKASLPRLPRLRAELQLTPDRPVILFASKLQERKNADHLILAYSRLCAGVSPEAQPFLVIVGDGEERGRLEALSRETGLSGIRFAGFRNQSELPAFFELADVFVLPSRHEPWGLIVNEVMAAGRAVIASSDVGAHLDLITNGIEGFVYPVGDVDALANCLAAVLRSPEIACQMGDAAKRRIAGWDFEADVAGLRQALAFATHKIVP